MRLGFLRRRLARIALIDEGHLDRLHQSLPRPSNAPTAYGDRSANDSDRSTHHSCNCACIHTPPSSAISIQQMLGLIVTTTQNVLDCPQRRARRSGMEIRGQADSQHGQIRHKAILNEDSCRSYPTLRLTELLGGTVSRRIIFVLFVFGLPVAKSFHQKRR